MGERGSKQPDNVLPDGSTFGSSHAINGFAGQISSGHSSVNVIVIFCDEQSPAVVKQWHKSKVCFVSIDPFPIQCLRIPYSSVFPTLPPSNTTL